MKFFQDILDRIGVSKPEDIKYRIKKESEVLDRAIEIEKQKEVLTKKRIALSELRKKNQGESPLKKAAESFSKVMDQLDDSKENKGMPPIVNTDALGL